MGKYMRKAKITADVTVMEVPQSTLGVRTRAKTLALQRLQFSSSDTPSQPSISSGSCYLQLRSRRLEKPSLLKPQALKPISQKQSFKQVSETKPSPRSSLELGVGDSVNSVCVGSGSINRFKKDEGCFQTRVANETEEEFDLGVEASSGENNLDFEARERSTRENTPCSLIRGADVVTPGSSTRQTTLNAGTLRTRNAVLRNIPSAYEMEEFFNHAEQQQQRQFVETYNFDIRSDMPLPGRYDWVRVNQ